MRTLSILLGLIGCLALTAGCGGGSSNGSSVNSGVVGRWRVTGLSYGSKQQPSPCPTLLSGPTGSSVEDQCSGNDVYTFGSNGAYTLTTVGSPPTVESGTYTVSGNTLTTVQNITSVGTTVGTITRTYTYTLVGQLLTLTCTSDSQSAPSLVGIVISTQQVTQ